MLSKEEVQHIAKLARLGLAGKEIKRFQKELSSILDYIKKLKEVDIGAVEPTSHAIKIADVMRADESEKPKLESKKLLELAPEKKENYLKTKSIFK